VQTEAALLPAQHWSWAGLVLTRGQQFGGLVGVVHRFVGQDVLVHRLTILELQGHLVDLRTEQRVAFDVGLEPAIDHRLEATARAVYGHNLDVARFDARGLQSFDRADAYVRVVETSNQETLVNVARACVQAGIVSQNIDRLANSDYRQAYETFSLICLLAKADFSQPILDVIAEHNNTDVRLKAVHLLASTGQPGVFDQLRELAVRDGVGEEVKTALLEAMYKLDQHAKQNEADDVPVTQVSDELQFETFAQSDDSNDAFAFAFDAGSEAEVMAEFSPDVHQEMDELEM